MRNPLHAVRTGAAWLGWAVVAGGVGAGLARLVPHPAIASPAEPSEDDLPLATHEGTDVNLRPMVVGGVLLLLGLGGVLGATAWLYPRAGTGQELGPIRQGDFPAPRLQTDVGADMALFRAGQLQQLNGAYWLDRERGRVHLPIADAMRDVAARGIADWPAAPGWVRQ